MADDPNKITSNPQSMASTKPIDSNPMSSPPKEVGIKDLMNKITNEGQLIRNTGTNSLKTINDNLVKFDGVFHSINKELSVHTSILRSMLSESLLEQHRAREKEDLDRIKQSEDAEHEKDEKKPKNNSGKITQDVKKEHALAGLFGSGWIAALLGIPVRAMMAIGALVAGDFVIDYILQKAKDWGVAEGIIDAISSPLRNGAMWGAIGLAISKRFGVYGLVAGAVWPMADQILDKAGLEGKTLFGLDLSGIFATILTGSALMLSKSMFSKTGMGIASKLATTAAAALASNTKFKFGISKLGMGLAGVLAASIVLLEEPLKGALEKIGMSSKLASSTTSALSSAANGAILGSMFGPYGMLVGAAIGLTYSLGMSIWDWLNDAERLAKKRLEEGIEALEILKENPDYTPTAANVNIAKQQRDEAIKAGDTKSIDIWNEYIDKATKMQGISLPSAEEKQGLLGYLDKNAESLEKTINGIANDTSKTPEDKSGAIAAIVMDIQEVFPSFSSQQIANELYSRIGDERWGGADDGNDYLESMQELGFWGLGKSGNEFTVLEGFEKFKTDFKTMFKQDFDPKNITDDQLKWIKETQSARSFFEDVARLDNSSYNANSVDVGIFPNPRPQEEGESDESYAQAINSFLRMNAMPYIEGLSRKLDRVDRDAVEKNAKTLESGSLLINIGGDTNVVATNNNRGGTTNIVGGAGGQSGRSNGPGFIHGR